ncbi:hypothetical protein C8Q76DRAFT_689277 [Earliella scabrosa]|nr:hypothetical protein C8Q76DRAFT_689277 [Earliella scabrosa]
MDVTGGDVPLGWLHKQKAIPDVGNSKGDPWVSSYSPLPLPFKTLTLDKGQGFEQGSRFPDPYPYPSVKPSTTLEGFHVKEGHKALAMSQMYRGQGFGKGLEKSTLTLTLGLYPCKPLLFPILMCLTSVSEDQSSLQALIPKEHWVEQAKIVVDLCEGPLGVDLKLDIVLHELHQTNESAMT